MSDRHRGSGFKTQRIRFPTRWGSLKIYLRNVFRLGYESHMSTPELGVGVLGEMPEEVRQELIDRGVTPPPRRLPPQPRVKYRSFYLGHVEVRWSGGKR